MTRTFLVGKPMGAPPIREIRDNADQPKQPARPWYRLHLSTCVVLVALGGFLVVLIFPGEFYEWGDAHLSDWGSTPECVLPYGADRLEHGWPLTFARGPAPVELDPHSIPWSQPEAWKLCDHITEFQSVNLTIDIFVGFFLLAVAAGAFEWRRRRRHNAWQFTLWELLALLGLAAGLLSWWQVHQQRYRRESRALLEISDASHTLGQPQTVYCGPKWLRRLVPAAYLKPFSTVTSLDTGIDSADVDLREYRRNLESLPNLRQLELTIWSGFRVDDAALDDLAKLPALEHLCLAELPLTDAGLKRLAALSRVRSLNLCGTKVTDNGLKYLLPLQNLWCLYLGETGVSDASIVYLRRLCNLKFLDLRNTRVTQDGIRELNRVLPECAIWWVPPQTSQE